MRSCIFRKRPPAKTTGAGLTYPGYLAGCCEGTPRCPGKCKAPGVARGLSSVIGDDGRHTFLGHPRGGPRPLPRPRPSLLAERHRADALVVELLHPFPLVGLGGVEVPLGI